MKKGIEYWSELRHLGGSHATTALVIQKRRGKLTLEDIRTVCEAYYGSFCYLLIDARGESDEQYGEPPEGDIAVCVDADNASFH